MWRWKYTTNHCQGEKNIYWKKKSTLSNQLKKSKDTQLVGQKEKPPLGLLSYNAKSLQYWVEQNSIDNYLVGQEITYYSFALGISGAS